MVGLVACSVVDPAQPQSIRDDLPVLLIRDGCGVRVQQPRMIGSSCVAHFAEAVDENASDDCRRRNIFFSKVPW
jgi:hypothetical protein